MYPRAEAEVLDQCNVPDSILSSEVLWGEERQAWVTREGSRDHMEGREVWGTWKRITGHRKRSMGHTCSISGYGFATYVSQYMIIMNVHVMGMCKTWTVDSGRDYGLDSGRDYGLDYGLDSGLTQKCLVQCWTETYSLSYSVLLISLELVPPVSPWGQRLLVY